MFQATWKEIGPIPRIASRCTALLALVFAAGAPAQLSINDWMTAGGYANLFLLEAKDTPGPQRENEALFVDLWKKTTGQEVMRGPEIPPGFINVSLGPDKLNEDIVLPQDMAALGPDGYFLSTYTPSRRYMPLGAIKQLVIAGNNPNATRMGIYGLFRRALDSEWFAPGVEEINRAGFRFEKRREFVKPVFAFREVGFPPSKDPQEREFRIANGLRPVSLPPQLGRDSAYALLPPEKFFDTHPEFYAERDGKRIALKEAWRDKAAAARHGTEFGDLCPSAPGIAAAIVDAIKEAVAAGNKPADTLAKERLVRAGWLASSHIWALTPMRGALPCQCAACTAKTTAEGTPIAPWLSLANTVAEGLDAAFPGETYRLLLHADGPLQQPPANLRAARNVIVMLFTTTCDFATPITDGAAPENKRFIDTLTGWGRAAPRVWIADYLSSLHGDPTPFPALRILQANLQFYAQHNVEGIYLQAAPPRPANDDFSALKYYLAARLAYDPDADASYLTERFLTAYYGDAAPAVAAYLHALQPLTGLSPTNSPQSPLLNARQAAQTTLTPLLDTLPQEITPHLRTLLP